MNDSTVKIVKRKVGRPLKYGEPTVKIAKRKGGRPLRYGEPTKSYRIPLSFEPTLLVLLDLWLSSSTKDKSLAVQRNLMSRADWLQEVASNEGGVDYE